jgi:cytochrome c biogenesis protein CcdA
MNQPAILQTIIQIVCIVFFFVHAEGTPSGGGKLALHFFGSPTCGECLDIKKTILFPARDANPGKIDLHIHDVTSDSGFNLLMDMENRYGVPVSAAIELFFPDTFLTGSDDIHKHGKRLIEHYLDHPEKWGGPVADSGGNGSPFSERLREKFHSYAFLNILFAGLVDGINPCAIATLVFLVSFLATKKRSRRDVMVIGICFTGSVFLTYLLMGFGAFRLITALEQYRSLSKIIKYSAASFAAIVGILSLVDALRFRKSRKVQDITLQLPKAVKLRIHKVISGNLSGGQLAVGAVVTGFLVTLLEAVCTGQVYLPTIVLMTKQEGLRFIGWLYLVFYNVLFVVPLIVVLALAYFGMKWERLAKTTQKHMVLLKTLLGVVLIGLAVFLAIAG